MSRHQSGASRRLAGTHKLDGRRSPKGNPRTGALPDVIVDRDQSSLQIERIRMQMPEVAIILDR